MNSFLVTYSVVLYGVLQIEESYIFTLNKIKNGELTALASSSIHHTTPDFSLDIDNV